MYDNDTLKYYNWLCSQIVTDSEKKAYDVLFRFLFDCPFIVSLYDDEDRMYDGLNLRTYNYTADTGVEYISDTPCSMLEMLVGLIIHVISLYYEDDLFFRYNDMFWDIIDNLGLLQNESNGPVEWDTIVTKFYKRKYTKNGKGNILYLPFEDRDVRTMSIWMQAMSYINYKYD